MERGIFSYLHASHFIGVSQSNHNMYMKSSPDLGYDEKDKAYTAENNRKTMPSNNCFRTG